MEIIFLGTGGGRINLIKQVRGTGGFRVESRSANIHVDPGPGALIHSIKNRLDPLSLDCVIVTHNHVDHVTDAMALIEGMTHYGLKKRGIIIGSRHTILGDESGDKGIPPVESDRRPFGRMGEEGSVQDGQGLFRASPPEDAA